jgi:hypothetical protein
MKSIITSVILFSFSMMVIAQNPKTKKTSKPKAKEIKDCGEYNGHKLYKGPKGGCFYKDKSSKTKKINKVYVDNQYCNC